MATGAESSLTIYRGTSLGVALADSLAELVQVHTHTLRHTHTGIHTGSHRQTHAAMGQRSERRETREAKRAHAPLSFGQGVIKARGRERKGGGGEGGEKKQGREERYMSVCARVCVCVCVCVCRPEMKTEERRERDVRAVLSPLPLSPPGPREAGGGGSVEPKLGTLIQTLRPPAVGTRRRRLERQSAAAKGGEA